MKHQLPIGAKPLSEIRSLSDPEIRLVRACSLLDYVLYHVEQRYPAGKQANQEASCGDLVQMHQTRFKKVKDMNWALGLRNRVTHPRDHQPQPSPEELSRAAEYLLNGIEDLLSEISETVADRIQPNHFTRRLKLGLVLIVLLAVGVGIAFMFQG